MDQSEAIQEVMVTLYSASAVVIQGGAQGRLTRGMVQSMDQAAGVIQAPPAT